MLRLLKKILEPPEKKALRKVEKGTKTVSKDLKKSSGKQQKSKFKSYEEQKRIAQKRKDSQHKQTEREYNEHFNGCPSCSRHGLTIQWIVVSRKKKAKSIECEYCNQIFEEKVVGPPGKKELKLYEVGSINDIPAVKSAEKYELEKHKKLGNL